MSTGVVAALDAEARTLEARVRNGILVAVSGIGGPAAAVAANRLADAGATSLVSWGLAGGLDPRLGAGTICLPETVVAVDGSRCSTDHHRRELVGAAISPRRAVVNGVLLASEHSLDDVSAKAAAFRATGAVAVDMESMAIARVAALRGLPFIAIRVIVDTAADTLPAAVQAATSAGRVHVGRLLGGLARSPRDLAPLLRLALRYRAARGALLTVARCGALAPPKFAATAANRIA